MGSTKELNIIHLDMDAFYASVEERDNPRLRGRPVIVGGLNNRGIVTTANYEARKFGIHSAMPIYIARRKCPKGCFVPTRIERYKEVSREIFKILYGFTDLIEPLSIDEAYMDISDIKKEPLRIAMEIKKKVMETTGLTMSVGISYNKFLAKLASDWNKPNGIKIITEDMVPGILLPLPVKSVHGIGPRSSEKLNNIGIYTVKDLLMLSEEFLTDFFGKAGIDIYNRIRGIDNRRVNTERKRKSIGIERTFGSDTKNKDLLKSYLHRFAIDLASSLGKRRLYCRTITLKIKDENFKLRTKSKTLDNYISLADEISQIGMLLLDEMDVYSNIRLIGLTVSNFATVAIKQLSLFDQLNLL
ncbi:MAG: DNA polymerase IV [Bacillota bacterium]|nr:DNA polymerase IV [Bacillota bacterium]